MAALPLLAVPVLIAGTSPAAGGAPHVVREWKTPQSGWLYILDHDLSSQEGQVLLVDPERGAIMGRVAAGAHSDMLLSPDGKRLYVVGILEKGIDAFSVIDTESGRTLYSFPVQNRWVPIVAEAPTMAISPDGHWLYLLKLRSITRSDHESKVAVFDTAEGVFLPKEAVVPQCVSVSLLASPGNRGVHALCQDRHRVYFLQQTPAGLRQAGPPLPLYHEVLTATLSATGDLIAMARDGRMQEIDSNSGRVRVLQDKPLADTWIPAREVVRSPDGSKLYVAIGQLAEKSAGKASEILALDAARGERLGTLRTSLSFWSLAISPDGQTLYAVDPDTKSILVINTTTFQETGRLEEVGVGPFRAYVAP